MADHRWDRDEMLVHQMHMEGIQDHLTGLRLNPGAGSAGTYGPIIGDQIFTGLDSLANSLYGSFVALHGVIRSQNEALEATVRAYSSNEQTNTSVAKAMITSMEGTK